MVAVREGGPDPLEQPRHPRALVVVPRLPRAGAHAAADHQHVGTLACQGGLMLIPRGKQLGGVRASFSNRDKTGVDSTGVRGSRAGLASDK